MTGSKTTKIAYSSIFQDIITECKEESDKRPTAKAIVMRLCMFFTIFHSYIYAKDKLPIEKYHEKSLEEKNRIFMQHFEEEEEELN